MNALPTFADIVRRERGVLTQDAFRDTLSDGGLTVTRQALSKWELGRTCPTAKTVARMATALRMTAKERTALLDAAARFERVAS